MVQTDTFDVVCIWDYLFLEWDFFIIIIVKTSERVHESDSDNKRDVLNKRCLTLTGKTSVLYLCNIWNEDLQTKIQEKAHVDLFNVGQRKVYIK